MELTVTMNYDGHELGTYSIDEFTYGELERQIEKDMNEYIGYQLEADDDFNSTEFQHEGWDGELDECPDSSAGFDSNTDLAYLFDLQEAIDEHEFDKVESAIECDVSLTDIDCAYVGYYEDTKEYAEEYVDSMGDLHDVPDYIQNNLDWEGIADDLMEDMTEHNDHYWNLNY